MINDDDDWQQSKPVDCFCLKTGKLLGSYRSLCEAANMTEVDKRTIQRQVRSQYGVCKKRFLFFRYRVKELAAA